MITNFGYDFSIGYCYTIIYGIYNGVLAAHQFKFNGAGATLIGTSAMLGSGAIHITTSGVTLKGIGDIINVILVVIVACFIFNFSE